MDRQKWLARRDSGSLGQTYRAREQFLHISKRFIANPAAKIVRAAGEFFTGPLWLPLPGVTHDIGRNKAKREARAGKPRKQWRRA